MSDLCKRAVVEQLRVAFTLSEQRACGAAKVTAALERVCGELGRGYPKVITVDNGTWFYSWAMDAWAYRHGGAWTSPAWPAHR